jgi:hypothetical protein
LISEAKVTQPMKWPPEDLYTTFSQRNYQRVSDSGLDRRRPKPSKDTTGRQRNSASMISGDAAVRHFAIFWLDAFNSNTPNLSRGQERVWCRFYPQPRTNRATFEKCLTHLFFTFAGAGRKSEPDDAVAYGSGRQFSLAAGSRLLR